MCEGEKKQLVKCFTRAAINCKLHAPDPAAAAAVTMKFGIMRLFR